MGKMIPNVAPWTYLLSFLTEITLDSFYSEKNGQVELFLKKGQLMLCAENAIYSYDEKYENFVHAFSEVNPDRLKRMKRVLVLGMGLASIPLILERQYDAVFSFTLIEYDEDLAELAQEYSLPRIQGVVEVVLADAQAYMHQNERRFDLICVDLFKDRDIPPEFLTESFFEQCRDALSDQGLLIMNTPGNSVEESRVSKTFFDNTFRKVFSNAVCIHLFKNEMLFSSLPS